MLITQGVLFCGSLDKSYHTNLRIAGKECPHIVLQDYSTSSLISTRLRVMCALSLLFSTL